jgi:DNA (cytosine-5)-methyltransferase 1
MRDDARVMSFSWHKNFGGVTDKEDGPCHTLTYKPPAVALSMRQDPSGSIDMQDVHPTLLANGGAGRQPSAFIDETIMRRLTARECERLMGWPDDWTRWDDSGNEINESRRYKMCGNGVVSNVAEWIGRRL